MLLEDRPSLAETLAPGHVAVVTGAASGIGRAAAGHFARIGMKIVLADLAGAALDRAGAEIGALAPGGMSDVLIAPTNVARREEVIGLGHLVAARFGPVSLLMNNAGIGHNPGLPWAASDGWKALFDVNLWGVVHGVEAFVPGMLDHSLPAMVINTGSKQGITSPPGNPAYNMSKAALKNYTESLAHALRETCGGRISAHLLIPGFTFTGITGSAVKPDAAWTSEQVISFMLERLAARDFYILCPDNAVDRATDEKRMRWAIDDIILNRPALSRWHPDFTAAFAAYVEAQN